MAQVTNCLSRDIASLCGKAILPFRHIFYIYDKTAPFIKKKVMAWCIIKWQQMHTLFNKNQAA